MLRQKYPCRPVLCKRHKGRKRRFESMYPLLLIPEPLVPLGRAGGVGDTKNGNDFIGHWPTSLPDRESPRTLRQHTSGYKSARTRVRSRPREQVLHLARDGEVADRVANQSSTLDDDDASAYGISGGDRVRCTPFRRRAVRASPLPVRDRRLGLGEQSYRSHAKDTLGPPPTATRVALPGRDSAGRTAGPGSRGTRSGRRRNGR